MIRVIRLPNGRQCSLGVYVTSWRALKALPADSTIRGWDHFASTAADVLRDLRYGMHDRINQHDVAYGKGRKWSADWQNNTAAAARQLNTQRLIVRWLPTWLRERFVHRLTVTA